MVPLRVGSVGRASKVPLVQKSKKKELEREQVDPDEKVAASMSSKP